MCILVANPQPEFHNYNRIVMFHLTPLSFHTLLHSQFLHNRRKQAKEGCIAKAHTKHTIYTHTFFLKRELINHEEILPQTIDLVSSAACVEYWARESCPMFCACVSFLTFTRCKAFLQNTQKKNPHFYERKRNNAAQVKLQNEKLSNALSGAAAASGWLMIKNDRC